jgi:hypothetical protein
MDKNPVDSKLKAELAAPIIDFFIFEIFFVFFYFIA